MFSGAVANRSLTALKRATTPIIAAACVLPSLTGVAQATDGKWEVLQAQVTLHRQT
jgi:hypothetical protein